MDNKRIEIYGMNPYYAELNGIYENIDTISKRIKELSLLDLFEEIPKFEDNIKNNYYMSTIAKCKICNTSHLVTIYWEKIMSYICEVTGIVVSSKWNNIYLHKYENVILSTYTIQFDNYKLNICFNEGYYKYDC